MRSISQEKAIIGQDTTSKSNRTTGAKRGRKRLLSLEDIEDKEVVEETNRRIEQLDKELREEPLISLMRWCEQHDVTPTPLIRLLNDANVPIIRIGDFRGVCEKHLNEVVQAETQRQMRSQLRNRVCSSVLAERQHARRAAKKLEKIEKIEKA